MAAMFTKNIAAICHLGVLQAVKLHAAYRDHGVVAAETERVAQRGDAAGGKVAGRRDDVERDFRILVRG